jgi:hypothetical protein
LAGQLSKVFAYATSSTIGGRLEFANLELAIIEHQTNLFEYLGLSPSYPILHRIMAEEIRAQSYVGFDSITQQIEHKLLKRGFQFNVIVVGELLAATTFHNYLILLFI